MDVQKLLLMKGGIGQDSYADNSLIQKSVIAQAKSVLEESTKEVYHALKPKCFMMADMGCSSGPNALFAASEIINAIDEACRSLNCRAPEFGVFLNDLSGNDFNTLFNFVQGFYRRVEEEKGRDFGPCFVSGTPRSFYGRVFPSCFLHFVPEGLVSNDGIALNKGNICIAKTSPPEVQKAYHTQFKRDFTLFLSSRAREVVPGGCMVLTFLGSIQSTDPHPMHELLGCTLHQMASEGMIEEEKLDKFNIPLYSASVEEVRQLVEAEGSFILNKLETFTVDGNVHSIDDPNNQAKFLAESIRVVFESLLANAFGADIIDGLFFRFEARIHEHITAEQPIEYLNMLVSMTKKA
ncbi:hypothetical protein Cgig2_020151 [Carnegiea gigantea]|uniref:Uncharacterized protein n=1 Tax=Carnegiea gigantea TaxID=171969 RepID=A0A9Q1QHT4_9CARY|nr:hypothetical protein Cgig2_020151 [Carnegiea gigantea]